MTGTTSSRGLSAFDIDNHRNQEWLRRRKLRLEQVRKQSNEIAKALRLKVMNEEKARLDEYDRMSEAKFNDWKACKLEELERKFESALEDFGKGYKLADEEPDPEEIKEERLRVNSAIAQKRGEIAKQEELKKKKIDEELKSYLIQRRKLIRKKEDLRSALVHSKPIKKQIFEKEQVPDTQKKIEEKVHFEKVPHIPVNKKITVQKQEGVPDLNRKVNVNKVKKKKVLQRSCMCKHKPKTSEFWPSKESSQRIWINLNEIQNSSTGETSVHPLSLKSSYSSEKIERDRPEGLVEFYDFSSRYYRKSFREYPHVVQRINPQSQLPNANDLAKMEVEEEKAEAQKKVEADSVSQERGMEALRRQRINQDYQSLITKLEELHKKEKILKAQQRNLPNFFHMSDERLSEKMKAKQRLMDSMFEDIISQIPRAEPPRPKPFCRKGGGDFSEEDERMLTELGFSSSRLKYNTPVTSDAEASQPSPSREVLRKPKTRKKTQLLLDIEKALKEGRELRQSVSSRRESMNTDGGEEKENSGPEEERPPSVADVLPEVKRTKCQESQTDDVKSTDVGVEVLDLREFGQTGDDSLPVSTSTSYKSPPSVIRSYRLQQFFDFLEGLTQAEDTEYNKKSNRLLYYLMTNTESKSEKKEEKTCLNPTLEYYIKKLLNLSREYIADLSVSSESVSTPNITDLDVRDSRVPESEHICQIFGKGEGLIRKSRLERAERLEGTIKNWQRILEKNSGGPSELEDVLDCPQPELGTFENENEEPMRVIYSPKISSRYEEITKKCSERICELSDMLDKVRKDKEKLLGSTSGGSSLSLNKEEGNSDKDLDVNEEEKPPERCLGSLEDPRTSLVEGFLNRYDLPKPRNETESTAAVADSQSQDEDLEESLESWPDVMDELLKRNILTSPFKWTDGEYSSDHSPVSDVLTKPSSIETVIGNFRREISKIKPFSLSDSYPPSDSFLRSHSLDERHEKKLIGVPCLWATTDGCQVFQEESSVESINQALTTLGLNWAKSFLRKNEESRAISSSSNSEGKCSGDEADDYL